MKVFLVGFLLISMALASERSNVQLPEKIESVTAVVGRVFVHNLPNEGGHETISKVSVKLYAGC